MSFAARNAGAPRRTSALLCTLALAAVVLAMPTRLGAATPRLLQVHPAEVLGTTRAQGASGGESTQASGGAGALRLRLQWDGGREDLQLEPNSALGVLARKLEGRAVAWSGTLSGKPGSWVALTRIGSRWTGMWFDGTQYFGIDDARSLAALNADAARSAPERTMVFRLADLKIDASFEGDIRRIDAGQMASELAAGLAQSAPATAEAVLPFKRVSVALVGDAELSSLDGAQTETNMLARLNIVDSIFASQLGVHLQSGSVTVLGSADAPPPTTVPGDLLAWLRDFRAASSQQRASGITHLMTGRDLDGRTVGIAYITGLCSAMYGSSLSQVTGNSQTDALVAAHEIGHVFGAPHDGDTEGACASTPTTFLMAPQINSNSIFSSCSLDQMQPALSRSCVAPYDAADVMVEAPQRAGIAIGAPADLRVTVRSVGRIAATGVNLRATLPPGGNVVSASGGSSACAISGLVIDCPLGDMAAGLELVATLRVQYDTPVSGTLQLRVSAGNDGLSSNDRATMQIDAAPGADLALTPVTGTQTALTGEDISTVLTLENRGPAAAGDARLTVQIPAGLQLVQNTPDGLTCVPVTEGLTCGPQALAAGSTARLTLTLRASVAASYVLTAQASASPPDMLASNNQSTVQYNVNGPPGSGTASGGGGGGGGEWSTALLLLLACLTLLASRRRQRVAAAK